MPHGTGSSIIPVGAAPLRSGGHNIHICQQSWKSPWNILFYVSSEINNNYYSWMNAWFIKTVLYVAIEELY